MPDKDIVMKQCDSTFISAYGYIGGEEPVLRVQFQKDGAIIDYNLVPEGVFNAMDSSARPGQYFRNNIWKAGYGWERV
jgi:hypothetical protein